MMVMMTKSLPARRVFTTARRDEVEQALHPATPAASWPQGPPQKTTRRPRSRPRSVPDPGRTGGPLHSAALGSPETNAALEPCPQPREASIQTKQRYGTKTPRRKGEGLKTNMVSQPSFLPEISRVSMVQRLCAQQQYVPIVAPISQRSMRERSSCFQVVDRNSAYFGIVADYFLAAWR